MSGVIEAKTKECEAFFDQFREVINTAVKFKKVMNKKGLRRAKCPCPRCGGFIQGAISSYNGHFRMSCEGGCGMAIME